MNRFCHLGLLAALGALGCNNSASGSAPEAARTQAVQQPVVATDPTTEFRKPSVSPPTFAGELRADGLGAPAAGSAQPVGLVAPTPAAVPASAGPAVKGEGFVAHLETRGDYHVGKPATVQAVLLAQQPFHCNDKYPYKFTGAPAANVTFKEAVVRKMSIGAERSTMDIEFTPTQAGKVTLSGELAFSVCTDDKCLVEKQTLSVVVDVKS